MASEHIARGYDEELRKLNNTVAEMGGVAESQLGAAIEAVMTRDTELAAHVVEGDVKVDQLERELDNLAIRLLALRQPVARDLREIFSALKVSSDLERIGDYAESIARRLLASSRENIAMLRPFQHSPGIPIRRLWIPRSVRCCCIGVWRGIFVRALHCILQCLFADGPQTRARCMIRRSYVPC